VNTGLPAEGVAVGDEVMVEVSFQPKILKQVCKSVKETYREKKFD
jgi:hypothetical protein